MKNEFNQIYSPEILEVISPKYPKWTTRQIKRKYRNYPAIYINVWQPYERTLFGLLPKKPWRIQERWRVLK